MKTFVLTGTKYEIAEKLTGFPGEIREAIVFVEEPVPTDSVDDIFGEMEPYTVQVTGVDDSRAAVYERMEGE